jgi:hypothetical protein
MSFRDYQARFAAHIRDPRGVPRPEGVPVRRMRVYNELLFNNIEGFLLACFPVCRQVLGPRRWTRLVRAFFRDHVCTTPLFRRIPEEFLAYLETGWQRPDGYPEFLAELAHYEWVELDLETSDRDARLPAHDPEGDLVSGRPLLNPVMHLLAYRWPVHRLGPRHRPKSPPAEPTCLLACRDATLAIRFVAISAATYRLLELLRQDAGLTGRGAIECLAREMGHPDPDALMRHGAGMLADLRRQGAVLGTLA